MANQNNIAEFILKITTQGTGEARQFAVDLRDIDQVSGKVASSASTAGNALGSLESLLGKGGASAKMAAGNFLGLNTGIGLVQQALGVGFSIAGIAALATSAAETVRSFEQIADLLDTDIGKASQMAFAVEKTGRSYEVLRQAAMFASVAIQQMPTSSAKRGAALTLGIDPDQAMTAYDLIKKVGEAYNATIEIEGRVVSQEEKMRAARELLGRSVVQLLPAFHEYWATLEQGRKLTDEEQAASENLLRTLNELKNSLKFGIGIPVVEFITAHKEILGVIGGLIGLAEGIRLIQNLALAKSVLEIVTSLGSLDLALIAGAGTAKELLGAGGIVAAGVALDAKLLYEDYKAWRELQKSIDAAKQSALDYASARNKAEAHANKKIQSDDPAIKARGEFELTSQKITGISQKYNDLKNEQDQLLRNWVENSLRVEKSQFQYLFATEAKRQELLTKTATDAESEHKQTPGYRNRQKEIDQLGKELSELRTQLEAARGRAASLSPPRLTPAPTVPQSPAVITDPKEAKRRADEVLKVLKDTNAAEQVERELAVKQGLKTELMALTEKYNATVDEYQQELAGLDQQQAALAAAGQKTPPAEKLAQEQALKAARAAAEAKFQEAAAASSLKFFELQQKQQKAAADLQVQLFEATGQKLLAEQKKINTEMDKLLREQPEKATEIEQLRQAKLLKAQQDNMADRTKLAKENYDKTLTGGHDLVAIGQETPVEAQQNLTAAANAYRQAILAELDSLQRTAVQTDATREKISALRAEIATLDNSKSRLARDPDNITLGLKTGFEDAGKSVKGWGELTHDQFMHGIADSTNFAAELATHPQMWNHAGQAALQYFTTLIQQIAQAIVQMMIMRALFGQGGMFGGFFSGGGSVGATPTPMAGEMAEGGFVRGFPTGGFVSGPGGPKDDLIPAMLSNGEYVLPAHVVDQLGVDRLDALRLGLSNRTIPMPRTGTVPAFAGGGVVGAIGNLKLPAPQVTTGPALFVFGKEEYARFAATTEGREMLREAARRNAAETGRALAARERGQQ